jgi:outer membrane lipoprotein carrier protein
MFSSRSVLLALCLLAASAAQAGAREQLAAFTRGARGLSANFEQQVLDPQGRVGERSSGSVSLALPRQFRWEYRQPFPQTIVADGDRVWIHDPDLEQVTVRNQSFAEQNSPLAALLDPGQLDRQFRVRELPAAGGMQWLELLPRSAEDEGFANARLGFGAAGLARMEWTDGLGQRTVVIFGGWRRNPGFAAGTFRFVPPPGVEVVGDLDSVDEAEIAPLRD